MDTKELEAALGYSFKKSELLRTALTHPSFTPDKRVRDYQRLEFLGDAVLELAVSRFLYYRLPEMEEGRLTRIRQALVCEATLSRAARKLALGGYIRMSAGEERTGGRERPSILCDVTESVIAAVYLDGGFEAAEVLILRLLEDELKPESLRDHLDAKSRLQEILQKSGGMPVYELISAEGPDHAPTFTYRVTDGVNELGQGQGSGKQSAQQAAAREALKRMGATLN